MNNLRAGSGSWGARPALFSGQASNGQHSRSKSSSGPIHPLEGVRILQNVFVSHPKQLTYTSSKSEKSSPATTSEKRTLALVIALLFGVIFFFHKGFSMGRRDIHRPLGGPGWVFVHLPDRHGAEKPEIRQVFLIFSTYRFPKNI